MQKPCSFLGCGWEWLLEESRTKQLKEITGISGGKRIEHPNDSIYFTHSETGPQAGTCGMGVGPEKLQQEEAIALNYPLKAPLCSEITEQHCKEAVLGLGGDGPVGRVVATETWEAQIRLPTSTNKWGGKACVCNPKVGEGEMWDCLDVTGQPTHQIGEIQVS